jgi:hypothetical protein
VPRSPYRFAVSVPSDPCATLTPLLRIRERPWISHLDTLAFWGYKALYTTLYKGDDGNE